MKYLQFDSSVVDVGGKKCFVSVSKVCLTATLTVKPGLFMVAKIGNTILLPHILCYLVSPLLLLKPIHEKRVQQYAYIQCYISSPCFRTARLSPVNSNNSKTK